jgi:hypothetical protein
MFDNDDIDERLARVDSDCALLDELMGVAAGEWLGKYRSRRDWCCCNGVHFSRLGFWCLR